MRGDEGIRAFLGIPRRGLVMCKMVPIDVERPLKGLCEAVRRTGIDDRVEIILALCGQASRCRSPVVSFADENESWN